MIAWPGPVGSASSIHGSATLSAWKLTYLFVLSSLRFSRVIGTKDKHASLAYAQEHDRGLSSVKCLTSATTYGYLSYDINAKFAEGYQKLSSASFSGYPSNC